MKSLAIVFSSALAVGMSFSLRSAVADVTNEELAKLVAEDVAKPVRPVGVGGQTEYWNVNATWYMYPPAFAFPEKKGAGGYRVRIVDANGKVRCFEQTNSVVSLEKFWMELPTGRTEVWCDAYSKWSHWTVDRHFRNFWKMAPYTPGSYPKAPRGYAEAATKCCECLLEMPWLKTYAETGKPDPTYRLNCYPTKMDAAMVELMVDYARVAPVRKAKALGLARTMADHLISISQPKDAPLACFPPTYLGKNYTSGQYGGMNMLTYPAQAGTAYLKLSAATGEAKYLEAAKGIAETYLKLQGEDGTWYLKMYEKDGRPVTENRLHPGSVIAMMDELFKVTGDARYRKSADRALGFYERGPLKDWNWEGQFEDVEPSGKYENLTKHPACELAQTLLAHGTKDAKRLAQARELLRFAEDQFVVWQRPKGDDADSILALFGHGWEVEPAVVEQYFYREAVDASAAKLIDTYLALYRASGNPLDLAKARTLGDSIVRIQRPNGRIPTIWSLKFVEDLQSDWVNCMAASVRALVNLSAAFARPVPSAALMERLRAEEDVIGIVHWGLNTFTDREWGYGDENPADLNPVKFDADQIVGACAAGGLKGLVVVAKHHDGFCLWPTKTTEHNIAKSPFRGGRGDYVREMADACRKHGLKFGVYVSPWDRNNANYGTAKYVETYHAQIKELLGGDYGEVFEMWFDGANGGDGYYGGAREKRRIPNGYYRFDEVFEFVRELQPKVCIFAGEHDMADFRWPGNERGELASDSRATICTVGGYADGKYGNPDYGKCINTGCAEGRFFKMCEADFPLRPGWFYHAKERGKSKHAAYLMNRYLSSVGNGGTMNIGVAPNKDGLLDEEDVKALKGFKAIKDAFFSKEVTDTAPFNVVVLRENLAEGERVDKWALCVGGRVICSGKSIGSKRIRILDEPVTPSAGEEVFVRHNVVEKGAVTFRRYFADPELLRQVRSATTESGETDTAKWMTGSVRRYTE